MALAPLSGFTIAVTADRRREEQVELLRRRGATVVEGPTVRTVPLVDDAALRGAMQGLIDHPPDVTVLLTGLGTRALIGAAESLGIEHELLDALSASDVVARGPKAMGAAAAAGLDVGWRAPGETSAEVLAHLRPAAASGARIAVQRDGDEVDHLARALREAGADVVDIPVYRWLPPDDVGPAGRVVDAVVAGRVDAVTFTSSPAVRNFVALALERGLSDEVTAAFAERVRAACVGPVCAETAIKMGMARVVVPRRARLGAMVQALVIDLGGEPEELVLAGAAVALQGAAALIDGEEVALSDRERGVLEALIGARGAVVSKRQLLRQVWEDQSSDEHAVEVTVARLRRRLGRAGAALQTVPRRGYRLEVDRPAC